MYSYRTELKDKFSIEGLREIAEGQSIRQAMSKSREEYKPLAKVEELEEQNYNQIDNVLNNTKPKPIIRPEDRPSVRARMKARKKELDSKNKEKAVKTSQHKQEKVV